jgi:hypothetical protein
MFSPTLFFWRAVGEQQGYAVKISFRPHGSS